MKMIETFRHDALFVVSLFFYAIILLTRRSFSEPVENVYQSLRLEYGGVLKQEWKYGDRDEIDPHLSTVIKFTKKYIVNRFPNSIPQSDKYDQVDFAVKDIQKKTLIYAPSDTYPVYKETLHMDNRGSFYKMTSLFILGVTYHLHLLWKKKSLEFIHNITISCYPTDKIHMFSHSFFVQHSNKSLSESEELLFHDGLFSPKVILGGLDLDEISLQPFKYKPDSRSHGINRADLDDQSGNSRYCHGDDSADCRDNEYDSSENIYRRRNPTFSVMSYNVWNMNSLSGTSTDYVKRMKGIQKIVNSTSPDIVGFQEVRYEDLKGGDMGPNQVGTLAELLPGYQFVFQPAQMQPNSVHDGRTEEGVAIFSRYPIISHDFIFLFRNKSNSADTHQRICLHAEIMIPQFGKVHLFVTHLSLSHEAREKSVIQIWQYMKQFEGPAILLGDLNAQPEEISVQYLRGKSVFDGEDPPILTDLWLYHNHDKQLGYTYNALEITLSKRIDYIFFKHGLGCCEVLRCDVIDDGKRGLEAASDHLPVISTLSLPG
ncbi:hypothetical protein CHS0354_006365 [Potamilus streckersoni]|uniref:Endonuclease/exonuclease/phosphatase domain-containing protein n=2 Tax=Potamilus streckersoni TaxID=2493646 RepID=A0AAE0SUX4_9BIVA|nr:hypothetical protein CHS0354_006365 [Potamilus streckersoni]